MIIINYLNYFIDIKNINLKNMTYLPHYLEFLFFFFFFFLNIYILLMLFINKKKLDINHYIFISLYDNI